MSQEQEQGPETASQQQRLEADPALEPELAHERDEAVADEADDAEDEPEPDVDDLTVDADEGDEV